MMEENEQLNHGFGFSLIISFAFGAILPIALLCYDKWQRRSFEKVASKMTGPPDYPIVGNGLEFIGTSEQILKSIIKLHREYGTEPIKIWMGSYFMVSIFKPVDIQIILSSSNALEKGALYKFFKFAVGEGLFTAPVEKWKRNHRLFAPIFKTNMGVFFDVFNDKNRILIEKLKIERNQTIPFDLWKYIAPSNLSIICQNAMDYDLDTPSAEAYDFIEAATKLSGWEALRITKPWLHLELIYTIYIKLMGRSKFYKIFRELPQKVIQQKKNIHVPQDERKISNMDDVTDIKDKKNKSFLDMMLELNKSGANLSNKELEDEVITFMIGGTETSAITVCSCLLLLAMHQDIQDKVYDEIYDVLGDGDDIVTLDQTYNLVYLEQVIKETLRIYPTAPIILRRTQDDVKISNHVLPKGTTCIISPFITHHLPEIYPDPWTFNPDNFIAENIAERHKYSYIPFSEGPRSCVGSKYAMLSMKVQISALLRNYSFHTDLKMSDVRLEWAFLLRHKNGFPVTIQSRDRKPSQKGS